MTAGEKRVVITGLGPVTPLGTGLDPLWQNLAAGRGGIHRLAAFPTQDAATDIAAEVRDFDPKQFVKNRKSLKVMARDIQLAVGAAELAVRDAQLESASVDPTRFGVNFGAGLIASELDELGGPVDHSVNGIRKFDLKKWGQSGMEQLFPLWMLKYLPNMPACHVSIIYNAQGPNNTITAGEAASPLAIGEAFRVIARGQSDVFLAGGTDSKIHPLSIVRMALINELSRRWDEPEKACRPFDAERDGVVVGEGAGVLVLEELNHAENRRANIYGEIVGFGSSADRKDPGRAIELAIGRALLDARITPADLGHIIPNGLSSVADDRREAIALARVLGESAAKVPIVGYKSYFGNFPAGNGAVELLSSLLAAREGTLPPTLNFRQQDAESPRLWVLSESIDFPTRPFLAYGLSYGGQCGALVVRPWAA